MANTLEPLAPTRFMARIVGPFLLAAAAAIALRAGDIDLLFPAFFQDAPLALVTGVFTLMVGLVMIASHQVWDSAAAVVLSVLGWIVALRGLLLMLAPGVVAALAANVLQHAQAFVPILTLIIALVGAWLAYVGFAKPRALKAPT